jgi:hypothetical protein
MHIDILKRKCSREAGLKSTTLLKWTVLAMRLMHLKTNQIKWVKAREYRCH